MVEKGTMTSKGYVFLPTTSNEMSFTTSTSSAMMAAYASSASTATSTATTFSHNSSAGKNLLVAFAILLILGIFAWAGWALLKYRRRLRLLDDHEELHELRVQRGLAKEALRTAKGPARQCLREETKDLNHEIRAEGNRHLGDVEKNPMRLRRPPSVLERRQRESIRAARRTTPLTGWNIPGVPRAYMPPQERADVEAIQARYGYYPDWESPAQTDARRARKAELRELEDRPRAAAVEDALADWNIPRTPASVHARRAPYRNPVVASSQLLPGGSVRHSHSFSSVGETLSGSVEPKSSLKTVHEDGASEQFLMSGGRSGFAGAKAPRRKPVQRKPVTNGSSTSGSTAGGSTTSGSSEGRSEHYTESSSQSRRSSWNAAFLTSRAFVEQFENVPL